MWIYIDEKMRVIAYNSNNMDGNTGWFETQDALFNPSDVEEGAEVNVTLFDHREIALYKYDFVEDMVLQRTAEEMDADYVPPAPQPDPTQRIADLEAAMAAIEEGIASV